MYTGKHPRGKFLHFEWKMAIYGKNFAIAFCRLILIRPWFAGRFVIEWKSMKVSPQTFYHIWYVVKLMNGWQFVIIYLLSAYRNIKPFMVKFINAITTYLDVASCLSTFYSCCISWFFLCGLWWRSILLTYWQYRYSGRLSYLSWAINAPNWCNQYQ